MRSIGCTRAPVVQCCDCLSEGAIVNLGALWAQQFELGLQQLYGIVNVAVGIAVVPQHKFDAVLLKLLVLTPPQISVRVPCLF